MIISGEIMRFISRFFSAALAAAVLFLSGTENAYALIPPQTQDTPKQNEDIGVSGFTLSDRRRFDFIDADVSVFEHDRTKAKVVVIQNDDPDKYFMLEFATPVSDDKGAAHVLEHSILGGSRKYPSKTLASAIRNRTYTTYLNAFTEAEYTLFPAASMSEEMLLKLADYVADSCFEPMLLDNEDIFRSEAWRLTPTDGEDIEINGTVYSEMKGKYTPDIAAVEKAVGLLDRGCPSSFEYGGIPKDILTLTYDDVKSFYDKYYNAPNCTAYLYGDIKNPGEFLALLGDYFDRFDSGENARYESSGDISEGFVQKEFDIPFALPSDDGASSDMVYALDLGHLGQDDLERVYAFTKCCNREGSTPKMYLQNAFGGSKFTFNILNNGGRVVFYVSADKMSKDQASDLAQVIGSMLSIMSEEGLADSEIENFRTAMEADAALSLEGALSAVNLLRSIANYHSGSRDDLTYLQLRERMADMQWFDGDVIKNTAADLASAPGSALSIINARPDLQKRADEKLSESLKAFSGSMSESERSKLTEDAKRIEALSNEDPSKYIEKLGVVSVSDLSDQVRDFRVDDKTDDTGVRHICVYTKNKGINVTKLFLDASNIGQDMLGYLALYCDIVNGGFVPAGGYDKDEVHYRIDSCTTDKQEISLSAYPSGEGFTPYVTVDFSCIPAMTGEAYDLAYTRLFESRFDDPTLIKTAVSAIRDTVGNNIAGNPDRIAVALAGAAVAPQAAYYEYTHYSGYYDFLTKLEKSIGGDYKNVCAKLESIGEDLCRANGTVIGCAVMAGNESTYREAADKFASKLHAGQDEKCSYDLEGYDHPLAVITGGRVVSNATGFKADSHDPADTVALRIMTDQYLRPILRERLGAYGCTYSDDYPAMILYTVKDPNIKETMDVYSGMGDAWGKIRNVMSQEDLDGYIITTYSAMSATSGELSDAAGLIDDMVAGGSMWGRRASLGKLKALKLQDLEKYDKVFEEMAKNGALSTAGSADLINDNAGIFAMTISPFE